MNLINIENLTKSYTDRKLFNGASFSLQEGEKVGVIGINGTGKTTLFRMIMGQEETDEGTVTIANHVVLRYLHSIRNLIRTKAVWTVYWKAMRQKKIVGLLRAKPKQ